MTRLGLAHRLRKVDPRKGIVFLGMILAFSIVAVIFGLYWNLCPPSTINSPKLAFGINQLASSYFQNEAEADSKYSGKLAYINGSVANVEKGDNGNYVSCISVNSTQSGCKVVKIDNTEWIIWNWENPSSATQVPLQKSFLAECKIYGLLNGTLILNACKIVG
jgi:tRNA_anti-like